MIPLDVFPFSKSGLAASRLTPGGDSTQAVGLFGSAAYALLLSRFRLSRSAEFTLISIASLFFVKHLVYDYIFLVVLLCFALTQESRKIKGILLGGVLTFWFLLPLLDRSSLHDTNTYLAINCCLLALLLVFTTYLVTKAAGAPSPVPSTETLTTAS